MSLRRDRSLALPILLITLSSIAFGQSTYGTILGTVSDSTGARVAGVNVTVTNQGEDVSRTVVADAFGNYEAINLKAGVYMVKSEAAGFKSFVARDLELVARQTLRVNVTLEVGSVTETVNVTTAASVVTTDTSTIATSFESAQVLTLPANYRGAGSTSPMRVLAFQTGVNGNNSTGYSVQGATPAQTEYSLDGISTVSVASNGALSEVFPSAEGIAEMKVQGVGNNAEYGQVGDITTTSKGGTNAFHGTAFEYLQNREMDATPLGSTVMPQKSANTFGGSLGGPVKKNRAFFFGTFEDMQYHTGTTLIGTVPTSAIRQGDFSNESYIVKDPLATGTPAFPNNKIPTSRINSVATNVLQYYPTPNYGSQTVQASSNYRNPAAAPITSWQWDGRGDYTISDRQSIFGRVSWKNMQSTSPNTLLFPADTGTTNSRSLTVSHVASLKTNLVNEFRFGFALNNSITNYNFDGKAITAAIGLKSPATLTFNGFPSFSFSSGTTSIGKGKAGFTFSHSYQWNNNTTWTLGRHTVKFGADVRRLRDQASLGFSGSDNYGNTAYDGRFSGRDLGDFLLGIPYGSSYASVNQDNDGIAWHYAVYVQDSFKATPKLSLEYGLRWELHPPFQDQGGNITNFDRSVATTGRVIIPSMKRATDITAPGFLQSINACPGDSYNGIPCTPFLTAQQAGWGEGLRETKWLDFNPRFGFAYRPFGDTKTVVRGGAGRYTMTVLGGVFYGLTGISSSDVREFTNSITNGVPAFQLPTITTAGTGIKSSNYGLAYFGTAEDPNYKDPYSYQWNMSVERDLGWETGVRVSYIALRSLQMPWAPDLNQPKASTTAYASRPLTDRPFPYWSRIYSYDTGANAMYNSMQTELHHRARGGLTFSTSWTWAKNLGDGNGPASTGWAGSTGGGRVTNSLDRAADRGNAAFTRRHRFTTSAFYDLPFGKGRTFGKNMGRAADSVIGGWRLAGVLLAQTGPYLTPTFTGGDPSGTNASARGSMRPDRVGSGKLSNPTASMYFDRTSFVCPGRTAGASNQFDCAVTPIGRFGNAGTGILQGPGTFNLSMGMGKDFTITERAKLRLEGTFTNIPNHPNLADPGTAITSISFGVVTTARSGDSGGNRVGQVSLRLEF
jgi:hypothetical protein